MVYSADFLYWDSELWVTACTVLGVVFTAIAWLFLLNAWIKGISKFFNYKAVFKVFKTGFALVKQYLIPNFTRQLYKLKFREEHRQSWLNVIIMRF